MGNHVGRQKVNKHAIKLLQYTKIFKNTMRAYYINLPIDIICFLDPEKNSNIKGGKESMVIIMLFYFTLDI